MLYKTGYTLRLSKVILFMLEKNQIHRLIEFIEHQRVQDIARAIERFSQEQILKFLNICSPVQMSEIFVYLSLDVQIDLLNELPSKSVIQILESISDDDRNTLFMDIPPHQRAEWANLLTTSKKQELEHILQYEEDEVVVYATKHFPHTYVNFDVKQTIGLIQQHEKEWEEYQEIYVLREDQTLCGVVSLKNLLLYPDATIQEILSDEFVALNIHEGREEAVHLLEKYDLFSIPIIDDDFKMVGVLTNDDIIDIFIEQTHQARSRFVGIKEDRHTGYLQMNLLRHVKSRITWSLIPIFLELVSGLVLSRHQNFVYYAFLSVYLPMIAAIGGNVGSQSASLIIRSLAIREVDSRDILRVFRKELGVSFCIGLIIFSIVFIKVYFFPIFAMSGISASTLLTQISLTIALAMFLQIVISTLLGAMIPFLATVLKFDPAILSAPVLASSVDIIGIFIYFTLANWILV